MPAIEVDHLRKSYRRHVAVHDVSFTVEEGEVFGILGANGAGKTTTVECIEGLRSPDAGSVSVLGLDPCRDRDALHQVLGVQLQRCELPDRLRVGEAVELFASFYPAPADAGELIERWGLTDRRDTAFRELSGGQRQRLSIVLALVGHPRVVVFDELTTGLDPAARRETWTAIEQIRDAGVTVLLVTHFAEEAERLCDRVAVIDAGRVVACGRPDDLVARVRGGQRLYFQPSRSVPDAVLLALPGVATVARRGADVEVTGNGELLAAVTGALAARHVVAAGLRLHQPSLDDALVALTGAAPADPA